LIENKPLIQWVYEQVKKVSLIKEIIVATDDKRIYDVVKNFGGKVVMTSPKHQSGTDRITEVVKNIKCDFVLNVQGDEPLVSPVTLKKIILEFKKPEIFYNKNVVVVTPVCRIKNYEEYVSSNTAKVVFDKKGFALYFSRAMIPYIREGTDCKLQNTDYKKGVSVRISFDKINFKKEKLYRHIGIYGYRKDFLLKYIKFSQSKLELLEKLEQLRILENGYKIKVVEVKEDSYPVDTREDLIKVQKLIKWKNFSLTKGKI
jgi:3-deoxy-manno-octulosonate cytidylyltransferase (CMP-KDO synthetase)